MGFAGVQARPAERTQRFHDRLSFRFRGGWKYGRRVLFVNRIGQPAVRKHLLQLADQFPWTQGMAEDELNEIEDPIERVCFNGFAKVSAVHIE